MGLFIRISYSINANEIDPTENPGITTTMKGLASLSNDLSLNNAGWQIFRNCLIIISDDSFSYSMI